MRLELAWSFSGSRVPGLQAYCLQARPWGLLSKRALGPLSQSAGYAPAPQAAACCRPKGVSEAVRMAHAGAEHLRELFCHSSVPRYAACIHLNEGSHLDEAAQHVRILRELVVPLRMGDYRNIAADFQFEEGLFSVYFGTDSMAAQRGCERLILLWRNAAPIQNLFTPGSSIISALITSLQPRCLVVGGCLWRARRGLALCGRSAASGDMRSTGCCDDQINACPGRCTKHF